MLHAEHHAAEEHRDGGVIGVHVRVEDGPGDAAETRVVEHHVEPPPLLDGVSNGGPDFLFMADVGVVEARAGPEFFGELLAARVLHIRNDDARAGFNELADSSFANTARAAGDDSDFAIELDHVSVPLGVVVPGV